MFINLKDLKPHRISKNLRGKTMLIYGPPGCGKTTFATSAPKSLLLAFEIGYNALDNIMVAPITNWDEAKNIASQLCRDNSLKEQYETIIVDTTSEAWNMVDKYTCNKREIDDLVYINFGVFKEHPRRLVVVHDNHARRQLLTLKRGQICHVYGLCRYFMGKGKKVNGQPTQELKMLLIATGILGWYVPTMVDIKKQGNNNDIVAPTDAENEIADFLGEIIKWKD